ncbi:MAG: hypothetical protein M3P34_05920 [Actinomycetota bacterium]|nr:hypothetical protein [Actinomycetota bacterium]
MTLARILRTNRSQLAVPSPVISEAAWLIENRLGPAAGATFLRLVTPRQLHDGRPRDG